MAEQKVVIVGTKHRGQVALDALGLLVKGETVTLRPEPENSADPGAIAVYRGDQHIGYIPARAAAIRDAIGEGEMTAIVSSEPIMQDGQCIELPRITVKWEDAKEA